MKTKTIELEDYPQVWKYMGYRKGKKTAFVVIVYHNRSETYCKEHSYTQKDAREDGAEDYDPDNEVELLKGHGAKRVHGMKTIQFISEAK